MKASVLIACLIVFFVVVGPAGAHTKSQSFSSWRANGTHLEGTFVVDAYRATLLLALAKPGTPLETALANHLGDTTHLSQNGKPCSPARTTPRKSVSGKLSVRINLSCPEALNTPGTRLEIGAFYVVSSSHTHIARASIDGSKPREIILTETNHEISLAEPSQPANRPLLGFIWLGVDHVWRGPDHLAFLVVLVLAAHSLRHILSVVTAFTAGHSIVLLATVLTSLNPNSQTVEALIGFSIALSALLIALPNLSTKSTSAAPALAFIVAIFAIALLGWIIAKRPIDPWVYGGIALFSAALLLPQGRPDQLRFTYLVLLAGGFGLVHGAGFAGSLQDFLSSDTPLVWPVLSFNLGVELGQLSLLALMWPGLLALRRFTQSPAIEQILICGLFGLGMFWFAERSITPILG